MSLEGIPTASQEVVTITRSIVDALGHGAATTEKRHEQQQHQWKAPKGLISCVVNCLSDFGKRFAATAAPASRVNALEWRGEKPIVWVFGDALLVYAPELFVEERRERHDTSCHVTCLGFPNFSLVSWRFKFCES